MELSEIECHNSKMKYYVITLRKQIANIYRNSFFTISAET